MIYWMIGIQLFNIAWF